MVILSFEVNAFKRKDNLFPNVLTQQSIIIDSLEYICCSSKEILLLVINLMMKINYNSNNSLSEKAGYFRFSEILLWYNFEMDFMYKLAQLYNAEKARKSSLYGFFYGKLSLCAMNISAKRDKFLTNISLDCLLKKIVLNL